MAKKWHPDRPGGSQEKVFALQFSSSKFQKHTRLWETLRREEFTTNTEAKVHRLMAQV
jgi:hypothetical protein